MLSVHGFKIQIRFVEYNDLDPGKFIVNYDVGAFLRSEGCYDKAIKYLTRAAEIDPTSIQARIMIASSRMFLGNLKEAFKDISEALKKDPDNLEAHHYSASILIMMNRLDEAEREISIALKMDPEGKLLTSPKALLFAARGEKDNALKLISNNSISMNSACSYMFLGMKKEAIRIIEEGIKRGFNAQAQYLYSYPMLAKNPIFKSLKTEARFRDILEQEKAKYEDLMRNFAKF